VLLDGKGSEDPGFRRLVEDLPAGVVVTDLDGVVLYLNPACEVMFKRDRDGLLGQMLGLPVELGRSFELNSFRVGQAPGTALLNASRITWEGREARLCFFQDITSLKKAEEERLGLEMELQHLVQLESLGVLASGVAHDMNNVLGAILGLASAHLARLPRDGDTEAAFRTIQDAAVRGGDMVKRLLNFARKQPIENRELDLNALLLEEVRLLERTTLANVRLDLDLAPDLRPIRGDGSALAHTFMNLCVNAVDAMGEDGSLLLRTRNLGGHQVEVRITDTGCGMTREVLARAMDPYYTTKAMGKGTGLGLSMAFTVVKAHGGKLTLQSEPGKGTTVRMIFPATVTQEVVPAPPAPAEHGAPGRPLGILVVDDDELIQKSTQMLVETMGHQVNATVSGEDALALLAQGYQPDAVILDLNMPGLGGKGTLPRLRDLCPTVPVLLATGRADDEAMALVTAHPFVTLLPKPFSFEALRDQLLRIAPRA